MLSVISQNIKKSRDVHEPQHTPFGSRPIIWCSLYSSASTRYYQYAHINLECLASSIP